MPDYRLTGYNKACHGVSSGTGCYDVLFSFLFSLQEEVQHRVDQHDEQEQHQCDGE